jgi:hypothetical protein
VLTNTCGKRSKIFQTEPGGSRIKGQRGATMIQAIAKTEEQKQADFEKAWSSVIFRLSVAHYMTLLASGKGKRGG